MSNETAIDDLATWVTAYREANDNAAKWKEVAEQAKQHITARLGVAEVGTVATKPAVRWSVVESTRFDTKKFRAQHPALAEAFMVPQITRRFTLVEPKDHP